MTDNRKMREAMIDQGGAVWEEIGGAWSMYWPAQSVSVVGEPLTCDECGAATDDPWHSSESGSRHFHRCDACHTAALEAQRVPVVGEPDCYDAGLLGDFGGGNVEWWQDYIRAELARAHDFYASQWPVAIPAAELQRLRKDAERYRWIRDKSHSLETRQYDKGIVNGPSCYHEVEGIRELKYEGALDAAIDAAIAQEGE